MSDSNDSNKNGTITLPTRTELVRALLIDSHVKRVVDVYMTPSFEEVVKLVGSSHFVPHRFGCLRGDTLYCDEANFAPPYSNFTLGDLSVTGNALVTRVDRDFVLVDCHLERDELADLVKWR